MFLKEYLNKILLSKNVEITEFLGTFHLLFNLKLKFSLKKLYILDTGLYFDQINERAC